MFVELVFWLTLCTRPCLQSQALQQHLGSTQQENKELRVAAVKAERHLDAYDRVRQAGRQSAPGRGLSCRGPPRC